MIFLLIVVMFFRWIGLLLCMVIISDWYLVVVCSCRVVFSCYCCDWLVIVLSGLSVLVLWIVVVILFSVMWYWFSVLGFRDMCIVGSEFLFICILFMLGICVSFCVIMVEVIL